MKGRQRSENILCELYEESYERKRAKQEAGVTGWGLFLVCCLDSLFEFRLRTFRRSDSERNPPVRRSLASVICSAPLRSFMASLLESCWLVWISLSMCIESIGYLTMEIGAGEGFLGNALKGRLFNFLALALVYGFGSSLVSTLDVMDGSL